MGAIVSKRRAVGEIFADLAETVTNSAAVGGKVAEIAAIEVVPIHAAIGEVEVDLIAAKKAAVPLLAAADTARAKASNEIRLIYDLTWNHVGRPASDARLSILFPSGAGHYLEGEADKLPERLELLAELFERGIHPKLSKEQNAAAADTIRAAAKAHGDAIQAARLPAAKVVLLQRTRTAMGRNAYMALMNFKRLLKVAGFTEAQIHEVIPDRKQSVAKKPAAKKPPASAPAPQAPAAEPPAAEGQRPV